MCTVIVINAIYKFITYKSYTQPEREILLFTKISAFIMVSAILFEIEINIKTEKKNNKKNRRNIRHTKKDYMIDCMR